MSDAPRDIDDALADILADTRPVTAAEWVPAALAVRRFTADDIEAPRSLPPFPASAMDGYALRYEDLVGEPPYRLKVAGASLAGHSFEGTPSAGESIRIFTGAPVPADLDTVVIQEDCERQGEDLLIQTSVGRGANVRPVGHDVPAGARLLDAGRRISVFDSAWLTACGIERVRVLRQPVVGIFSTGDELLDPGQEPGPGQIFDANRQALTALFAALPVVVRDFGIVADQKADIATMLEDADANCDMVVTSGGVSVGEADWVRQAVSEMGTLGFWKLNLKPGKPLAYGRLHRAAFFGLPGNPVSTIVTAILLVKPALERLCGGQPVPPLAVMAILRDNVRHSPGREEYQRGWLARRDGRLEVIGTGDQSSNRLASFAAANCLIKIDKHQGNLDEGAEVVVLPFHGLL